MISKYRKQNNMSQADLAIKLNVSQQLVSLYEKGKRQPPIDILIKLSDLFGCTIDELVRGEKNDKISN